MKLDEFFFKLKQPTLEYRTCLRLQGRQTKPTLENRTYLKVPNLPWSTEPALDSRVGKPNLPWSTKPTLENQTYPGVPNLPWNSRVGKPNLPWSTEPTLEYRTCLRLQGRQTKPTLEYRTYPGVPNLPWSTEPALDSRVGKPNLPWSSTNFSPSQKNLPWKTPSALSLPGSRTPSPKKKCRPLERSTPPRRAGVPWDNLPCSDAWGPSSYREVPAWLLHRVRHPYSNPPTPLGSDARLRGMISSKDPSEK
jgi:hypothetical protein